MRPGFDDKVLADWNGLMIAALANAADAFERADWLAAAERAFDFVCTRMSSNGRLLHAYRDGEAKAPATANDYANMIRAALALANVTGKRRLYRARESVGRRARHGITGRRISAAIISPPTTPPISSCGRSAARTRRRRTPTA